MLTQVWFAGATIEVLGRARLVMDGELSLFRFIGFGREKMESGLPRSIWRSTGNIITAQRLIKRWDFFTHKSFHNNALPSSETATRVFI